MIASRKSGGCAVRTLWSEDELNGGESTFRPTGSRALTRNNYRTSLTSAICYVEGAL